MLTRRDLELFRAGDHPRLYEKLGAHASTVNGVAGASFVVWAPQAGHVAVVGDFNGWDPGRDGLHRTAGGLWSGFVAGVTRGARYKYRVEPEAGGRAALKADPFAFRSESPPGNASLLWDLDYAWGDEGWMAERGRTSADSRPMSIYECHLGSWRRAADQPDKIPGYREIAAELVPYLLRLNFTHVELLPPTEHPFYGSWGYQTTGYFAANHRHGTPQDLMFMIDRLHQAGVGVILDWVPAHFPADEHGLARFDGTRLYEYPDPRVGYHQDWKSYVFNYGRGEVQSFLVSSALFWLERYHADGLRVDAVASMLYLDYSRKEGEWIRNKHGGRENLEAIAFLRKLNDAIHAHAPGTLSIAEESTTWPMVSRPTWVGGLGFDMKWDMGWMHDTLRYMGFDPIHRKFHHDTLTFRMLYAFSERFVLPLSHDEVVHGKGSLVGKMPGDDWKRFASLRLLYGYMWTQPGKKLLFMGGEFGQWREWSHDRGLDWELLQHPLHAGLARWVADLNRTYRAEPALHELDFTPEGFRWVDGSDADQGVISFTRHPAAGDAAAGAILAVFNFTPVPRHNYRIGVPHGGWWRELLNSDAHAYGGSDLGNLGGNMAVPMRYHSLPCSLCLTLPPLSALLLRGEGPPPPPLACAGQE